MDKFEITAGLLISIAIRLNPTFTLRDENEQLKTVREAALIFQKIENVTETTRLLSPSQNMAYQEITGAGYYRPDIELVYRGWAKDEALLEATRLAAEKPEYDGVKPSISWIDDDRTPASLIFDGTPHPSFMADYLPEREEEDS